MELELVLPTLELELEWSWSDLPPELPISGPYETDANLLRLILKVIDLANHD